MICRREICQAKILYFHVHTLMLQSSQVSIVLPMCIPDLMSGNPEIFSTAMFIFVMFLIRDDSLKKYVHTVC
jgi:hypothetical protein